MYRNIQLVTFFHHSMDFLIGVTFVQVAGEHETMPESRFLTSSVKYASCQPKKHI